ncbi:MAG: hypothetical protein WC451_00855 [Patescibacteria group bacterium]
MLLNILKYTIFPLLVTGVASCAVGVFGVDSFGIAGVGLLIGLAGLAYTDTLVDEQHLKSVQWLTVVSSAGFGLCIFGHAPLLIIVIVEISIACVSYAVAADKDLDPSWGQAETFLAAVAIQNLSLLPIWLAGAMPWWGNLLGVATFGIASVCLMLPMFNGGGNE